MKKKIVIIIAVMLMLVVCFTGCHTKATFGLEKSNDKINLGEKSFEYLADLSGAQLKSRKANSEGELTAAKWLRDNLLGREEVVNGNGDIITEGLSGFGYQNADNSEFSMANPGLNKFEYKFTNEEGKEQVGASYNVSATKKSKNSKGEIILGTYYDNCYGVVVNGKAITGDGSYESGASVAVLLAVAEQLGKIENLPYDITIVFFGAGSIGYIGAQEYVAKMDLARKENVKLMINYNQIIGGANMYMYSRDFGTDYNDYFYEVAKANEINATKVPSKKNVANGKITADGLQNYFHIGMIGNNLYFMNGKIPTVNFMSFDWSTNEKFYNTEFAKKDNVFQTDNDTIGNLVERSGGIDLVKAKMNDIASITLLALSEGYATQFETALSTATKQEVNEKAQGTTTATALSISIKVALVGIVIALMMVSRNHIEKNKDKYKLVIQGGNVENGGSSEPKREVFEEFFGQDENNKSSGRGSDNDDHNNNPKNNGNDVFDGF